MGVPVRGVNELVLEVTDVEAAEEFYAGVLGFPVLGRWEAPRKAVWVLAGATRIGLWLPQVGISRGRPGVHVHYALSVDEQDYDGVVEHIRDQGHVVDEVDFGNGNARSAYVADPDGHIVEFWTWDVSKGSAGTPRAVSDNVFGLPA